MEKTGFRWNKITTYILLVACAVTIKFFDWHIRIFISLLYFTVDVVWLYDIIKRFIQKNMRNVLIASDILMMYWHILRLIKYEFVLEGTTLSRYMWYSYYIPLTFIPVLFFWAALYIGRTEQSTISAKWYWVLIVPFAVSLGVMTNDWHQMAFRFYGTDKHKWALDYSYGPLYYIAVAILAVSLMGIMVLSIRSSVRTKQWIYIAIVLFFLCDGILYMTGYASGDSDKAILKKMFEMPEFVSIYFLTFWETLVYLHMIPSNEGYEQFFEKSSLRAGLADLSGDIRIKSSEQMNVTPQEIVSSLDDTVLTEDGRFVLKSYEMKRGIFCWEENIEELSRLNEELEDNCNYLVEENYMINKMNKLDELTKRDKQKNEVYDSIARNVMPQIVKVSGILNQLPEDEDEFSKNMKYASVFMVYIKRCSNLRLLANSGEYIDIEELGISISESLEYVSLMDIVCHCEYDKEYRMSSELVLCIFQIYQEILEHAIPSCNAVLVMLNKKEDNIVFYMEVGLPEKNISVDFKKKELENLGAKLDIQVCEESESVTITKALAQERTKA